jgi:Sec-independent protein secretion pathway component TatC
VLAVISPENVAISTIIAIAILGVFAGSLVAFLVFKKPNNAKAKRK